MLNSHQILAGARTKGGIKTYVDADYIVRPETSLTGSVFSFTGAIELDGVPYNLADFEFDASSLGSLLPEGKYVLGAVPSYDEPQDRAAAESAGLNYYIDRTPLGESTLHYFMSSELEAEVSAEGGYNNLAKLRAMGAASPYQIQLVTKYSDALEKLSDPRYVGQLLEPTGVEYILKRVLPQDNRSRKDALANLSNQQLEMFKATQGYIAAERIVDTAANQASNYDSKLAKVKRAFAYASEEDAKADVNAVEIRLDYNSGDTLASPVDLDGEAIDPADASHIALFEYYQPTYMSKGHHGTNFDVLDMYTKNDSMYLGRINPIYQANDMQVARLSINRARPLSAVTKYGYPLSVATFDYSGGAFTISSGTYTPGALIPSGGPTPTPVAP
jgi:hypothetical protein